MAEHGGVAELIQPGQKLRERTRRQRAIDMAAQESDRHSGIVRGDGMADRQCRIALRGKPGCRTTVQNDPLGGRQPAQQEFAEEIMIAEPVSARVEPVEEKITPAGPDPAAPRCRSDRTARRTRGQIAVPAPRWRSGSPRISGG
ncbi:hypothetical protein DEM27_30405 [Metarhizobium album]|uniref:Uncharacterized protein n=1 Tax=Metarhizobium album TaxID=2182425 RepID=A0A2U2DGX3_9HYPH|nr:hypothetical protein DEM27_30405 [Rhizobium album]